MLQLEDGHRTTFDDLLGQYEAMRQTLGRIGVGRGSGVVSAFGNRVEFLPLFVACLDLGAVLVPVGEVTDAEAAAFAVNAGASAVVSARALPLAPVAEAMLSDDVRVARLPDGPGTISHGTSIVMRLTSGSTDLPKATLASEENLIADGEQIAAAMDIRPADINMGVIPLSHAYAIGSIVMPLILQGMAVALRSSFSPSKFLADAHAGHTTVFPGVPFMYDHLRHALDGETLPDRFRLLITAGATIDPTTVRWFDARMHRKIHSFYGCSETGGITFDASDGVNDPIDVGRPLPGVTVEIRREPGTAGAGRVFVRGRSVAGGYANAQGEDSTSAFRDGGYLTSDLGYIDAEGRLVLTGRVSPLVNVAGRKVDPAEVERVLLSLPGVTHARALGVSSRTRGQELVAFVVRAHDTLTPLALRKLCAAALSPYKIPRRFVFLDEMPLDARGKIDRRRLQALAEEGR